MDFILKDLQLNMSMNLDDKWDTQSYYNWKFDGVEVVERGTMVKSERDVWQVFGFLNHPLD